MVRQRRRILDTDQSMKEVITLLSFIGWVAGVVIAQGFWSTFFAILIPFWAWYLLIERIVQKFL